MRSFFQGFIDSLSIGLGYLPIAFSFGLTAIQAQLSPFATILMSILLFAGASQFMLVSMLASGASAIAAVISILLMNIRHIFYGPSLASRLEDKQWRLPRPVLAFGITDEAYAAAISRLEKLPMEIRQHWLCGLEYGAYSFWVLGTILGCIFGDQMSSLSPVISDTLNFVLPALFFSLLLEIAGHAQKRVLITATFVTVALLFIVPGHIAMLAGMLCGASQGKAARIHHG